MKIKEFVLRMVPVLILVFVTAVMSIHVYNTMLEMEEEACWNTLEIATNSMAQKIKIKIDDNLNFLETVADAYPLTHNMDDLETVGGYLDSVVEKTIFQRIDIILPDESLITQGGDTSGRGGNSSYDELVAKGTHITPRVTSSFTGGEVICCVTPIEKDGEVKGLLVGTISCDTLSEMFQVFTYGEACQLYMIDQRDGNYLMDNWHDELGNINDLGLRQSVDSDEMIDMVPSILQGESARYHYWSLSNGEKSYQYSVPVEGYDWTVCVVVQEDVAFANVLELQTILLRVGIVGLILILLYVLWNMGVNMVALNNEKKLQEWEYNKAKNEARSKFISNMSHDIKTPLNGIVGMLEIIKNHEHEQEVVKDCLKKIEISAQYLSTLTSDMLDINEIENNKLVLQEDAIDLRHLVDELNTMMEKQAKDVGVTYEMDCSQLQNTRILGSSVHIKRVLVNLISNAIKYSKKSGKHVWVTILEEAHPSDVEKRIYRFVIKDNGIGMSEEFQKNMYRAFEQEIIDARSEYQGYGLGLTIVNYLIKKMSGTIVLESEKNVGSTFIVTLPLKLNQGDVEEEVVEQIDLSGLHILLVEDNEFNMEIAQVLLTDAGATIDTATDGKQATEIFAASNENFYNAIIMDVMMPVMDGCEATQVIREMDRADATTVPIIAMTASTFSEDVKRCREAGMNAHVPKPLEIQLLMTTIAKCSSVHVGDKETENH